MRILFVVPCVVLFAGNVSAWAADCNKGFLWPFMRSAGECLTQTEKSQGMTGVYGGAGEAQGGATPVQIPPAPQSNTAAVSAGASSAAKVSATPAAVPAAATAQASAVTATPSAASASCQKGFLWPFMRSAGECLTQTEKSQGMTGVYGGAGEAQGGTAPLQVPPAPQTNTVAASAGASSAAKVSATPAAVPAAATAQASAVAPATSAASSSCQKGWLWPFVREPGDCPTGQDRKNGAER
jgi:hypothetical protein